MRLTSKAALLCAITVGMTLGACGDDGGGDDEPIDAAPRPDAEVPLDADLTPPAFVVTPTDVTVLEGGTATFTVALDRAPVGGDLEVTLAADAVVTLSSTTLTFTADDFDDAQTVTVTGVADADAEDETGVITLSATDVEDATVDVTVDDDDSVAISLTPTTATIDEAGTGTIAVALTAQPAADVVVSLASSDTGAATASPASMTFTPANFSTPQNVTVTGVDDVDVADETVTLTASATGLTSATATVTVTDDDDVAIVASAATLGVTEGDAAGTFTVALSHQPAGNVTVTVASSDTAAATAAPAAVTFTPANYATPQTVSVTGVEDADVANESATVTLSSAGLTSVTVAVTVTDDDQLNIDASVSTLSLTEGGANGTFTVALTQQPSSDVVVSVVSSDVGAAASSPATMTFTSANYATPQTVTVVPVNDNDTVDELATVTLSATGLASRTVSVGVDDDDSQILLLSTAALTVTEGGTATFTARLAFDPLSTVSVGVGSADTAAATASPATLSFDSSNYSVPQTVTVTGVHDADLAAESVVITLNGAGAGAPNATVTTTVTDDDSQSLVVTPTSLTINENGNGTFTVALAFAPSASVTVNVASGATGVATVAPASLTFTPFDYATPQTVTVTGVQDADLINGNASVSVTSTGLTAVNVSVTVVDDDTQNIQLTTSTVNINEGSVSGTVGVRLAFDPGGSVTVNVASSDTGAATVSPAALTFNSGNYSTNQTVTIAPVSDDDTADEVVTASFTATGIPAATATVNVNDDDNQVIVTSPDQPTGTPDLTLMEQGATGTFTARLAFNPVTSVTVAVTSPDAGAASVSPATLTFNSTNWMNPQTVTVAGVSDPDLVDEDIGVELSSAIAPTKVVDVRVVEDDLQDLVVSTTAVTVTENTGPGSFTVRLAYQPPGTVGVTVASANTARATVAPTFILFTTTNYATPVTVAVDGTPDVNMHDTSTTATISSPGLTSRNVAITVLDDDDQAIVLSRTSMSMNEADVDTFTARLAFEPLCQQANPGCTETVAVTSSNDGEVTAAPATLAFTAADFATPQTVTVTSLADADILNENVTITLESGEPSTPDSTVAVQVLDDDTQNFDFDTYSVSALTEGGATGTICVRLTQDPSGTLVVTATSADTTTLTTTSPLSFTSANYLVYQCVTATAVHDVDLLDENVNITFAATGVSDATRTIAVTDDDTQDIVVAATATVNEGGNLDVPVSLAFQPTVDLVVHVATQAGEDKYTASPAALTFTPSNWNTPQNVQLAGVADDDLDDHARTLSMTTAPEVAVGTDEGDDASVAVTVLDNDAQVVLVTTDPGAPFPVNVQEEGPTNQFVVALQHPPRDGIPDVVELSSANPELEFSVDGSSFGPTRTLTFTTGNFSTAQLVWVRGLGDYDDINQPDQEEHDAVNASLSIPGEVSPPGGPGFSPTTQLVTIIDDELTVLQSATYTGLDGATLHTKRQNIAWAHSMAVVSAYEPDGDTVLATVPRDDLGDLTVGATIGQRGGSSDPVEAVEFIEANGASTLNDVGTFITTTGNGVAFARHQEDLSGEVVAPTTVVASGAMDFWPTYDGTQFGIVWRDSAQNNLFFRTVSLAGALGTVRTVTAPTGSAHQEPNLHPVSGGGWIVLYTTAAEVRCVRLQASGVEVPGSNVILPGLPAGVFVSSIYNPDTNRVIATLNNPTRGLSIAQIDPADCGVDSFNVARPLQNGTLLNTPFIAYNGFEYKIAYDQIDGTVGVVTLDLNLAARDDLILGAGARPAITWAGDRWLARFQGSVELMSGSFQSHCGDGVENLDEEGLDCGGADCAPCTAEFGYIDTPADDVAQLALYNFFVNLQWGVSSSDYIYFEVTSPGLPTAGAWCSTGADWFVNNYLSFAPTGGGSNSPAVEKWERPAGTANWNGPYFNSYGNSFGTSCDGTPYSWCSEWGFGRYNAVMPGRGAGYPGESYNNWWRDDWGQDYAITIRVGRSRQQTCGGIFP